jgi:alpha-amylase/alpha-mannosidase (GH57 family)
MPQVRLAFLWHMHQPLYRDPDSGDFLLPWVRLHATRAYYDMAWMLDRHPAVRCTVNFTPVLLEQLEATANGDAKDRFLDLSAKPAADLRPEERQAILRSFFMIDWETCIRPLPRYWELLHRRGRDLRAVDLARVAATFEERDLRDLQVLFNLAWFGFAALEDEPGLRALREKGRHYAQEDLAFVLSRQQEIVRGIAPRWRALSERGQVELSSTPYFHPILPLVCDTDAARRALPGLPLPPRFAWPEDARWHVREAIARHERTFGARPAGMWPAEGSVSPEALEILASEGVRWAATDEGVLFHSLGHDGVARLRSLYRPWAAAAGHGAEVRMLFRDRGLSDLIGFTYARTGAREAAADLVSHVEAIGAAWREEGQHGPATVGVFLDGENPWEHYPHSGREFLEALYETLERHPKVRTVTMSEATADVRGARLERIHSGSWIESSFRIWMGHEEDRRAWAALGRAREAVARAEADGSVPKEAIQRAKGHLYAAEGSDWYWWYGDDFHTDLAAEFDALFRSLVVAACQLVGAPLPIEALEPIKRVAAAAGEHPIREPTLLLQPAIDGRETHYFEWQGSGVYHPGQHRGSMFGGAQAFQALRFGFDLSRLYLRLDPAESAQRCAELADRVRVEIVSPDAQASVDFELVVDGLERHGRHGARSIGRAAFARVAELELPFEALALRAGDRVAIAARVLRGDVELERLPRLGYVTFTVPDEDFERIHWRV